MSLHVCIDLREKLWKHVLIIVELALKWHQDIKILISRTKVIDVKKIYQETVQEFIAPYLKFIQHFGSFVNKELVYFFLD